MIELDIVLLYIRSYVWGIFYAVGHGVATLQTPRRYFPCDVRQRKVLDIAIDEVSGGGIVYAYGAPGHTDYLWYPHE
jgi:hypothetical protein